MKLTKLMLSACVAALALASCNKNENGPVVMDENLKSVEISLSNVQFATKGPGHTSDLSGTDLQLNTIQLFFTDGTGLYTPKMADGATDATTYLDAADASGENLNFHYLPAAVNKVIAIGNSAPISASSLADLELEVEIGNQQDPTNLILFAESQITTKKTPNHDTAPNAHETDVYTVALNLLPRVARFELNGFSCNFTTAGISSVEIAQVHFVDYFNTNTIRPNANSDLRAIDMTSQTTIFNHLLAHTAQDWDNDLFDPAIQLTVANNTTAAGDINLAYNFYPGVGAYPRFVLYLTTDGILPSYLATTTFRTEGGELLDSASDFKPGYIYRITDFAFSDTDLTHQDRCVEITLSVSKWNVVSVLPNFN